MTRLLRSVASPGMMQWMCAAVFLWLAFILAMPGSTVHIGPNYRWFASIGEDPFWELRADAMLVISVAGLLARPGLLRVFLAGLQSMAIGIVAYGFFRSAPNSTGTGIYGIVMLFSWIDLHRQVWRS